MVGAIVQWFDLTVGVHSNSAISHNDFPFGGLPTTLCLCLRCYVYVYDVMSMFTMLCLCLQCCVYVYNTMSTLTLTLFMSVYVAYRQTL